MGGLLRGGLLAAAALGACAAGAGAAGFPAGAARWLMRPRPLPDCDLMVVPAGGAHERLATAVELMAGGACGRVLFTGRPPGAEIASVRALLAAVDPGALVEPPWISTSTAGDAVVAREVALRERCSSVLVVTSPYHTRRATWIFSAVFAGSGVRLGVHPSAAYYMDLDRWWSNPHGRAAVAGEYAKLWLLGLGSEVCVMLAAASCWI